jgi:HAD superfamily hydrolase (TIGR01549 family)
MKRSFKNRRVQWIFFDIGDVLVNEDRLRFNLFRILEEHLKAHAIDLSFEEILACREDLILDHADESPHYTMAKMYLPEKVYEAWRHDIKNYIHHHLTRDLILVPGIDKVVHKLSRTYSLGLIADQPHEIVDFLKRKKLLDLFKVQALSGLITINKPAKKIFEFAVNQAGCSFGKCVMIGDRIDRDILPAKQLDMRTIQVRWNTYRKGFKPRTKKQTLYLESLHRIKNWKNEPASRSEKPDAVTDNVFELPEIIDKLG